MKYLSHLAVALTASLVPTASARALTPQEEAAALLIRALPANAPHGYTPQNVTCPSTAPSVRSASSLSPNETDWLPIRRNATVEAMRDLLGRMNITGLDTGSYIDRYRDNASALPNIGIAISGGGYRAMLNGAGVIEAFDNRTTGATGSGQLGGLLQSATYLAGLSGGSWLVGSIYANNFTSVDNIISQDTSSDSSGDVWQLEQTIFEGPKTGGIQLLNSVGYYGELVSAVQGKNDAGFNTTITDYWGRALSYQLVNASDGGPDYTFSSIAQQDWFTTGTAPLPLIVADSRAPGQKIVSSNSTVFTFDPWEFGSNDPTLFAFVPMQYVGTNFSNGSPVNQDNCVVGFDNVGYVFGTSSTLFNSILTTVDSANTTGLLSSALQAALEAILGDIGADNDDIADYPNPFFNYDNGANQDTSSNMLTLVDGGEDGQNIPFNPLIQPIREVDVIFAVDGSADTNASYPTNGSAQNWPAGFAPLATYQRSLTPIGNGTGFPEIPDTNTFINLGLNYRPTFFGCEYNETSPSPLIVYLPNAPYSYNSNTSTFDMKYSDDERNALVLNAYNLATQGNATIDREWPTCVGCAILSRSLNRTGTTAPSACTQCFTRYCWNGTYDSSTPASYEPVSRLSNNTNTTSTGGGSGSGSGSGGSGGKNNAAAAFTGSMALTLAVASVVCAFLIG